MWHFSPWVLHALLQSSVHHALQTKFGALSTLIVFCTPGTTNKSLCSVNLFPLSASSVAPSFFSWPDFWDRDEAVPSLSGSSDFGGNWSWASMSPLVSPVVNWAEPSSTWSHLLCTVWWCGTLLESACWLLCESCTFAGVISQKGDDFCMALRSAASQPTCCCSSLGCFWSSCHQP